MVKESPPEIASLVRRHALGWLVAANVVGVLLAVSLLFPGLNFPEAPFTYGRWMPLHMDWQLYGWCAIPLVGVLLRFFLNPDDDARGHVAFSLGAWSLALALGGAWWLSGRVSGKLFLDWSGLPLLLFPLAMCVLWGVLATHALREFRHNQGVSPVLAGKLLLLILLLAIPTVMHWSAGPKVYPPVNPHSGGATGASLLGSTLGIIVIYGALPLMLGIPRRPGRSLIPFWGVVTLLGVLYGFIDRGHASHHARNQIIGLGSLLIVVPAAAWHFSGYNWPASARRWLFASFGWWSLLAITGFTTFLPDFSERLKFTNGLVAHAHLAMAGLVTSMNMAILASLDRNDTRAEGGSFWFWLWQIGNAVLIAALLILGWVEGGNPGALFLSTPVSHALYAVRLLGGLAMLLASIAWAWKAYAPSTKPLTVTEDEDSLPHTAKP